MTKTKLISFFLTFGISVFPLYLWASGQPQLSHFVLLIFIMLCLTLMRQVASYTIVHGLLGVLCCIIFIRQLSFAMDEGILALMPFLYIFYNALLFLAVCKFLSSHDMSALRIGVILSILIAVLGVVLMGFSLVVIDDGAYRVTGTFNNPNQTGYFSICLAGIAASLFLSGELSRTIFISIFAGCIFLAILSLSKAAMVGISFYLLIFLRWNELIKMVPLIAVISPILIFSVNIDFEDLKFIDRLAQIGSDSDDSLEARGYGVLFDPDIRIIYGWGEGYVQNVTGHETHSTIGNIIISYGLVGFTVFVLFLSLIFLRVSKRFGLIVTIGLIAPVMLYGITHNGFRFSIFWVYLAVIYTLSSVSMVGHPGSRE